MKSLWSKRIQGGVFGSLFIFFAVKGLINGEMCGFGQRCTYQITYASSPVEWVLIQGICWGLGIFLFSRVFKP